MKMAGGAHLDQIDPGAFLEQAAEYESSGDLRDGALKLLNTERTTHPFAYEFKETTPLYGGLIGTDDHSASFVCYTAYYVAFGPHCPRAPVNPPGTVPKLIASVAGLVALGTVIHVMSRSIGT